MSAWSLGLLPALLFGLAHGLPGSSAPSEDRQAVRTPHPLHPPVVLRDVQGEPVARSGRAVSTLRSCADCHDTRWIAGHSYHADLGLGERAPAGARTWDWGPGPAGRWNPLTYRLLSPEGRGQADLDAAEWTRWLGGRHVGGGPAAPAVEMNCFLCHVARPDLEARNEELVAGRAEWANTATLAATGLLRRTDKGWTYDAGAMAADGSADAAHLALGPPTSTHCGACHGQTHFANTPLELDLSLTAWSTATKGQVFSPQHIDESAVNIAGKQQLAGPWDVHAERLVGCKDCHFSLNHPAYREPDARNRPAHLRFEPRRLAWSEYLRHPSHQFAKGDTVQGKLAGHLAGSMRRCEDCHDASHGHDWLPYRAAHFDRLSCEACHVPAARAPAVREIDWTLLSTAGEPTIRWRGTADGTQRAGATVTGFRPALLPTRQADGRTRLVPHNLIAAWYWVDRSASRPVQLEQLKAALLDGERYQSDVARALGPATAVLDTQEKVATVRRRLMAAGVRDPQIEADVTPYAMHHGVAPAAWAMRDCQACHSAASRLAEPMVLASAAPGGVMPRLVGNGVCLTGPVATETDGQVIYRPQTRAAGLYVLGHDRWRWVNVLGGLAFCSVLAAAMVHAGLRVRQGLRNR
jgi:hypothetical protein